VFYPIWEAASLDEWLYNGGPYQLIVCHFFLGVCSYMGREWELSYRLGMRANLFGKPYSAQRYFASNACPEDSRMNSQEPGELQKTRRQLGGFTLPISDKFLTLIETRKSQGKNVYLKYMEFVENKIQYYKPATEIFPDAAKSEYIDIRTNTLVYLEKHRINPGFEGGLYTDANNVVLLALNEHIMAHYLRFLQYGKSGDRWAVAQMVKDDSSEIRRDMARRAGQIGGKKQQEILRAQKRGWYNSEGQRERSKLSVQVRKNKKVGIFHPDNLFEALEKWKEKYNSDPDFKEQMLTNLRQGLITQKELGINIYSRVDQRVKSILGKCEGLWVDYVLYQFPYITIKKQAWDKDKKPEYTEEMTHMSEDFFWNHVINGPLETTTYFTNKTPGVKYPKKLESEKRKAEKSEAKAKREAAKKLGGDNEKSREKKKDTNK